MKPGFTRVNLAYFASDEEIDYYENQLGVPLKLTYGYRRINTFVKDIAYIREIKDNKKECEVVFKGMNGTEGYSITVLSNYDDLCITLNDIENNRME